MKLKYTFETMEIDDQIVAVPVGDNSTDFQGIVKLNNSALMIFEMLKMNTTKEQIVEALSKKYDTPVKKITEMVNTFVDELIEEGIVE